MDYEFFEEYFHRIYNQWFLKAYGIVKDFSGKGLVK